MQWDGPKWLVHCLASLAIGMGGCSTEPSGAAPAEVKNAKGPAGEVEEGSFADDLLDATRKPGPAARSDGGAGTRKPAP